MAFDGENPGSRLSHCAILLDHAVYFLGGGSGNRSFNGVEAQAVSENLWVYSRACVSLARP